MTHQERLNDLNARVEKLESKEVKHIDIAKLMVSNVTKFMNTQCPDENFKNETIVMSLDNAEDFITRLEAKNP